MRSGGIGSLKKRISWPKSSLRLAFLVMACLFADIHSASAIPAFARKYGLPCSACHEAWPKLNNFGQVFKDNGYQLENDRDSPIFQNNAYFPITFRITPQWHLEHLQRQQVDAAIPGTFTEQNITTS